MHDFSDLIPVGVSCPRPASTDWCPYTIPTLTTAAARVDILPYEECADCPKAQMNNHQSARAVQILEALPSTDRYYGANPVDSTQRLPDIQWVRWAQLILQQFNRWSGYGFWPKSLDTIPSAADAYGNEAPNFVDVRSFEIISSADNTVTIDTSSTNILRLFGGRNGYSPIQVGDMIRFRHIGNYGTGAFTAKNCAAQRGLYANIIGFSETLTPNMTPPESLTLVLDKNVGVAASSSPDDTPVGGYVQVCREYNFPEDWFRPRPWAISEFFWGVFRTVTRTAESVGADDDWETGKFYFYQPNDETHCAVALPQGDNTILKVERLSQGVWEEIDVVGVVQANLRDALLSDVTVRSTKEHYYTENIRLSLHLRAALTEDWDGTGMTLINASLVSVTKESPVHYEIEIAYDSTGEVTVRLPAGMADYDVGNGVPTPFMEWVGTYYGSKCVPQIEVTAGLDDEEADYDDWKVGEDHRLRLEITFDRPIKRLSSSDFTCSGCVVENLRPKAYSDTRVWECDLIVTASTMSCYLAAGAAEDHTNNETEASIVVDSEDVQLSTTLAIDEWVYSPVESGTFPVNVVLDNDTPYCDALTLSGHVYLNTGSASLYPTSNLTADDFVVAGGVVSNVTKISNFHYTFDVTMGEAQEQPSGTPIYGRAQSSDYYNATLNLRIAASSLSYTYDTEVVSNAESNSVVRKYPGALAIVELRCSLVSNTSPTDELMQYTVTAVFDRLIPDLTPSRIATTGPAVSVGDFSGSGNTYTFSIVASSDGQVNTFAINEGAIDDYIFEDHNFASNVIRLVSNFSVFDHSSSRLQNSQSAGDYAHASTQTWVELGGSVQGVDGYTDYMESAEAVRLTYFWETTPTNPVAREIVGSSICRHSFADPGKTWGQLGHTETAAYGTSDLAGVKWFCEYSAREDSEGGQPSGLATYCSRCYQFQCNNFSPLKTTEMMTLPEWMHFALFQLWHGSPGGLVQLIPGVSDLRFYRYMRFYHPSIHSMMTPGDEQRFPNTGIFPLLTSEAHAAGMFGYLEEDGTWRQGVMHDQNDADASWEGDGSARTLPEPGVLSLSLDDYEVAHSGMDNSAYSDTTDPAKDLRRNPLFCGFITEREYQAWGEVEWAIGIRDSLPHLLRGWREWQRLAHGGSEDNDHAGFPERVLFGKLGRVGVQSSTAGTVTIGGDTGWDENFEETGIGAATYGAIVKVAPHPESSSTEFPFGMLNPIASTTTERYMQWVRSITDIGNGEIQIECYPSYEKVMWAYVTILSVYPMEVEFSCGGNVCGVPSWMRLNSAGSSWWRAGMGPSLGALPGHTIQFYDPSYDVDGGIDFTEVGDDLGGAYLFQVKRAIPFSGQKFWWNFWNYQMWWLTGIDDYLYDCDQETNDLFYDLYMAGGLPGANAADFRNWGNRSDVLIIDDPDGRFMEAWQAGKIREGTTYTNPSSFIISNNKAVMPGNAAKPTFQWTRHQYDNWQDIADSDVVEIDPVRGLYALKKGVIDTVRAGTPDYWCLSATLAAGRYSYAAPFDALLVNRTREALECMNTIYLPSITSGGMSFNREFYQEISPYLGDYSPDPVGTSGTLEECTYPAPAGYWGASTLDVYPYLYYACYDLPYVTKHYWHRVAPINASYRGYYTAGVLYPERRWSTYTTGAFLSNEFLNMIPNGVTITSAMCKITASVTHRYRGYSYLNALTHAVETSPDFYEPRLDNWDPSDPESGYTKPSDTFEEVEGGPIGIALFGLVWDPAFGDYTISLLGSVPFTPTGSEQYVEIGSILQNYIDSLRDSSYAAVGFLLASDKLELVGGDVNSGFTQDVWTDVTGQCDSEYIDARPNTIFWEIRGELDWIEATFSVGDCYLSFSMDGATFKDVAPGVAPIGNLPAMGRA